MNARDKHFKKVDELIRWLEETQLDEARQACSQYQRTIRNSRMDWQDRTKLRFKLDNAIKSHDDRNKPKLTVIDGEATFSRPRIGQLRLVG